MILVGAARHGTACQCQAPPHSKGTIVSTYYEVPGMTRVRRAGTYSTAFSHCPLWRVAHHRHAAAHRPRLDQARPDPTQAATADGTGQVVSRLPRRAPTPHRPPAHAAAHPARLRGPPAISAFFSKLPSTPHTQRAAAAGGDPLGRGRNGTTRPAAAEGRPGLTPETAARYCRV